MIPLALRFRRGIVGKRLSSPPSGRDSDDFISVVRRLGADESKERFEAKLKKIAKAKPELKT